MCHCGCDALQHHCVFCFYLLLPQTPILNSLVCVHVLRSLLGCFCHNSGPYFDLDYKMTLFLNHCFFTTYKTCNYSVFTECQHPVLVLVSPLPTKTCGVKFLFTDHFLLMWSVASPNPVHLIRESGVHGGQLDLLVFLWLTGKNLSLPVPVEKERIVECRP